METNLTELVSTVKTRGTTVCFRLGKPMAAALSRFGFEEGQEVVLRLGRERLEIRPRNRPEEVRAKLRLAAGELKELRDRIEAFTRDLPQSEDLELEDDESLEAELLGLLEVLVADDLDPAIAKLESVSKLGTPPRPAGSA
jgi:hypothetical protein